MWRFQGPRVGADGVLTPRAQGAGVAIPYVLSPEPPEGGIKTYEPRQRLNSQQPSPDSKPTHLLAVGWKRVQADPSQAQ